MYRDISFAAWDSKGKKSSIILQTWELPKLWLTAGSACTVPVSPLPNFPLVSLSHHLTSDSYHHSFLSCHSGHGKHSLLCSGASQTKQAATISSTRTSKAHTATLPNFLTPVTIIPRLSPSLGFHVFLFIW